MKILIPTGIYPPDIGGPATYVPKIASRMLKDGIQPIVITYSDTISKGQSDNLGFLVVRIKRTRFFVWNYFKYFISVLKYGKRCNGIYLQDYFSAGVPTILANIFLRKKLITKVVGIFSWEQLTNRGMTARLLDDYISKRQALWIRLIKFMERKLLESTNKIIVPSIYMKNLLTLFGVSEKKIEVIYNSFDYFGYTEINKIHWKEAQGLSEKNIYLSVGRLVEWKNFDVLIKNFKSIDGVLFIIGDGPLKESLSNLIRLSQQEQKIFLLGSLSKDDVYDYYQVADVFVLLSSYEGMSHVLIEAMSMGLYIISSNIEPNIETLLGYSRKKIVPIDKVNLSIEKEEISEENIDLILERYNFEKLYLLLLNLLKNVYKE